MSARCPGLWLPYSSLTIWCGRSLQEEHALRVQVAQRQFAEEKEREEKQARKQLEQTNEVTEAEIFLVIGLSG